MNEYLIIDSGEYLNTDMFHSLVFNLLNEQTTNLLSAATRRDFSFESSAEKNAYQHYLLLCTLISDQLIFIGKSFHKVNKLFNLNSIRLNLEFHSNQIEYPWTF